MRTNFGRWHPCKVGPFIPTSGLVSKGNKKTLERAVNSLQRNGVGIKGEWCEYMCCVCVCVCVHMCVYMCVRVERQAHMCARLDWS